MLLSSKHLALASPYFAKMFQGDWKEAQSLRSGERLELREEIGEPEALLILMRVIHGRTKEVPRKITLGMLESIAIFVDYYKCLEVVEIISEIWIKPLEE